MVTFSIGDYNQGVKSVQKWCNLYGFTDKNGNKLLIDGKYGTLTASAVKKFQNKAKDLGLYTRSRDGVCGPYTLGAMEKYGYSNHTSTTPATPTTTNIPDDLKPYLQPTANCQSNDTTIIDAAKSIIGNSTSTLEKATKIFNWVRNKTSYLFYKNTRYGAVGEYAVKKGNCCDMAHLLNALYRAAGIPARYLHVNAKFSSGTFGHVISQPYVDGKWLKADATDNDNTLDNCTNWKQVGDALGVYKELPF